MKKLLLLMMLLMFGATASFAEEAATGQQGSSPNGSSHCDRDAEEKLIADAPAAAAGDEAGASVEQEDAPESE